MSVKALIALWMNICPFQAIGGSGTPVVDLPVVQVKSSGGLYLVQGTFEVSVPHEIVWSVLSDYDHLNAFVGSMKKSIVRERQPDGALLEQEMEAKALFVTHRLHVLLKVHEEPGRKIVFYDVLGADFETYQGGWFIGGDRQNTTVLYRLRTRPKSNVPKVIGAQALQTKAMELLTEVRAEMLRRYLQRK